MGNWICKKCGAAIRNTLGQCPRCGAGTRERWFDSPDPDSHFIPLLLLMAIIFIGCYAQGL